MLRYSDQDFIGIGETYPAIQGYNVQNNTNPNDRDFNALGLIYTLAGRAPTSNLKYAADQAMVNTSNGSQMRYGLVQCTRDISAEACTRCLTNLTEMVNRCCEGKRGWRILAPSCNIRYEDYSFFNVTAVGNNNQGKGGNKIGKIAGITLAVFLVVMALLGFCLYKSFRKKKRRKGSTSGYFIEGTINATEDVSDGEMHYYSFNTIQAATNNFSDANKLGEGGFGPVYKGKLVEGKEIAVKRLAARSGQGLVEFKNEVQLLVKLQHRNLVRLLGCCIQNEEKLLVYEFLANSSLDAFLFDQEKSKQLDWDKRVNIANGIARGLLYLHEDSRLKIIHRDLKASNVLLDDDMNAKISDFGTARIFGGNQIEANTNRVVGTYGYMAPEYAMEGFFFNKI